MSEPNTKPVPATEASPAHYIVLCGLCLGLILLALSQPGQFLDGIFVVLVGVVLMRMPIGPLLLIVVIGGLQMRNQAQIGPPVFHEGAFPLQIDDLVLSAGVLGYVLCSYRLQTFWRNLWPEDPRQKAGPPIWRFPWFGRRSQIVHEKRPQQNIPAQELVWLFMSLPAWALGGSLVWLMLGQDWDIVGLDLRIVRLLLLTLFLGVAVFVGGMILGYWRHRRRDEETARLFLQDVLWKETRGEQRRINRWLAWSKKTIHE